ncbi:hypothetical protein IFO70_34265 [Phormidium tenue FACHB-886]|nr:hypothetical protein [Phormidium tenue FACHB-886]
MYVIQLNQPDQRSWLKGVYQGWLTSCNTPSEALHYQTLPEAEKEADYYSEMFPESKLTVQSLLEKE